MAITSLRSVYLVNTNDKKVPSDIFTYPPVSEEQDYRYVDNLHIVRNNEYVSLAEKILIAYYDDLGNVVIKKGNANLTDLPATVTIDMKLNTQTIINPMDLGIEMQSTVSGGQRVIRIRALALPTDPNLPAYKMYAQVTTFQLTITVAFGGNERVLSLKVFVHNELTKFWLTPDTITLRPVSTVISEYIPKFSVIALFDNIHYADITELHDVILTASNVSYIDTSNQPQTGKVVYVNEPASEYENVLDFKEDVKYDDTLYSNAVVATVPDWLRNTATGSPPSNSTSNGNIKYKDWVNNIQDELRVRFHGGPGFDSVNDRPNILFISEGYTNRAEFERYVDACVADLYTAHAVPFNYLIPQINIWSLFISSDTDGSNIISPYYTTSAVSTNTTVHSYSIEGIVKKWRSTDETLGNIASWLADFVKRLGIPNQYLSDLLASGNPTIIGNYYAFLNDNFEGVVGANDLQSLLAAAASWAKLKNMLLFNENDSVFGIQTGKKPGNKMSNEGEYRFLGFNYRRLNRFTIDHIFSLLTFNRDNDIDAANSEDFPNVFSLTQNGKDIKNIGFLCKNPEYGGINIGKFLNGVLLNYLIVNCSPNLMGSSIRASHQQRNFTFVPPSNPSSGGDLNLGRYHTNSFSYIHTIAHEIGHSYEILDEYDEGRSGNFVSNDDKETIQKSPNNIHIDHINKPIESSPNKHLDDTKLKWNRYIFSSAIKVTAGASSGTTFTFSVADNLVDMINEGDSVQITKLPVNKIMTDIAPENYSIVVQIEQKNNNTLTVTVPSSSTSLSSFPQGNNFVVLKLVPSYLNPAVLLRFIAPKVMTKMMDRNGSLTMNSINPLDDFMQIGNVDRSDANSEETADKTHLRFLQMPIENNLPAEWDQKLTYGDKQYKLSSKITSKIIGLYVGGNFYERNVYHSAGECMYRHGSTGEGPSPACPICSYHLILTFDYTAISQYCNDFLLNNDKRGNRNAINKGGQYYIAELNNM